MSLGKKKIQLQGTAAAAFDPLQNFETVTYTGNGSTQKITGYIRKGAAFNDSNSEIETTYSLNHSNAFSISLWARQESLQDVCIFVATDDAGAAPRGFQFRTDEFFDGTTAHSYTNPLTAGQWHNMVLVYNGSDNVKIYRDGSVYQNLTSTLTASAVHNLTIGQLRNGTVYGFGGKIDQVRVFSKAISSSEVTTLYGETHASTTKSTTDIFGDSSGVALYELDEDANSSNFGQAAVFDGSSSYVDTNLPSLTNTFSFSAWLYLDNFSTSYRWVFANWSSSSQDMYLVVKDNGQIEFNVDGNNGNLIFGSTGDFTINNWHHLVITMNAGAYTVYLDNVSLGSGSTTNTTFNTGNDFQLGKAPNSSINEWDGKMDDVRIYSDALTTGEIGYLYNNTVSSIPTDNLTLHYKFDGNATDETGTYDGTENSITYSAGVYGGTPTNVNFLGMAFQPDLVWIKSRNFADNHQVADSVRGNTKYVIPNGTNAENTSSIKITSFDSNGFTLGSDTPVNDNNDSFVAWCWKSGGAAVSNTDGTITSTVSANTDAGFSIVKYSGNSTMGATIGHGLSATIDLLIVKNLTEGNQNWRVQASALGGTKGASLNTSDAFVNATYWNNTAATSTVFTVDNSAKVNATGDDYIAYCFHSVDGYQKVGSYTGTGTTSSFTGFGFQPRWILLKRTDSTGNWWIFDNSRGNNKGLRANLSNAEDTTDADANTNEYRINFLSDGFQYEIDDSTNASGDLNALNGTYIYLAIA